MAIFEVGLIYLCTFNDSKKSNTQKAILFDLPDQDALNNFRLIKVLLAPPGCKDISYSTDDTKQSFFDCKFVETSIECAPRKIHPLKCQLQGVRKQYGLQH